MERVAFLIEETGRRVSCLLNPESVVLRRFNGVKSRRSLGGAVTATPLGDDPLLYTGGGVTEIDLDLLFDLSVPGNAAPTGEAPLAQIEDVRELTRGLHELTRAERANRAPIARLIWGKSWDVPCVVLALAERFDRFTTGGVPQRSWLRLRVRQIAESPVVAAPTDEFAEPGLMELESTLGADGLDPQTLGTLEMPAATDAEAEPDGEPDPVRLDLFGFESCGSPGAWRALAFLNDLEDPSFPPPGTALRTPPAGWWEGLRCSR